MPRIILTWKSGLGRLNPQRSCGRSEPGGFATDLRCCANLQARRVSVKFEVLRQFLAGSDLGLVAVGKFGVKFVYRSIWVGSPPSYNARLGANWYKR